MNSTPPVGFSPMAVPWPLQMEVRIHAWYIGFSPMTVPKPLQIEVQGSNPQKRDIQGSNQHKGSEVRIHAW